MSGSWRARRLSTLALLLASFTAALLLAEATLRTLRPPAASIIRYPCIYVEDERFGFRYQAGAVGRVAGHFEIDNTVHINALGFHDDDPLPAGASELRVLAVGDSFTAGLNLGRDEVWTAVLERELRERGYPSADVVNLGIDGTGTEVHRDLLRAFIPEFRPDVAILAFYANDIDDALHGRFSRECYRGYVLAFQDELQRMILRRRVEVHLDRRFARWLFDHSFLVRMLEFLSSGTRNLFRLHYVQPSLAELGIDEAVKRARRPRLRAVFADLEALARGCGCRFLVVPVPPRRSLDGSLRVLRRWIEDTELELVDVVPAIEKMLAEDGRRASDLFWANDNHLNAYGNRLFARALAEAVPWRPGRSGAPRD
jgi:lysophospholipase L1-like esterase